MLLEEPGQGPKTDKASILIAAISTVTNLRREIGQLRQLNKYLEVRWAVSMEFGWATGSDMPD